MRGKHLSAAVFPFQNTIASFTDLFSGLTSLSTSCWSQKTTLNGTRSNRGSRRYLEDSYSRNITPRAEGNMMRTMKPAARLGGTSMTVAARLTCSRKWRFTSSCLHMTRRCMSSDRLSIRTGPSEVSCPHHLLVLASFTHTNTGINSLLFSHAPSLSISLPLSPFMATVAPFTPIRPPRRLHPRLLSLPNSPTTTLTSSPIVSPPLFSPLISSPALPSPSR